MPMMNLYGQLPLDTERSDIRLLHIHPSEDPSADFSCDLRVVSLASNPEYAAISYVWGEKVLDHTLHCNGLDLPVTSTLYSALHAVRKIGKDLVVWADQICINQDENAVLERTAQVAQMGRLYSQARRVLVYLGEATPETNAIRDLVMWIWLAILSESGDQVAKLRLEEVGLGQFSADHQASIKQGWYYWLRMCENIWFTRIWVLQEAICAPIVQIIIGEEEVGPEQFLKLAFRWLSIHQNDDARAAPIDVQMEKDDTPDHPESDHTFETLDVVGTWNRIEKGYWSGKRPKLISLLSECRRFNATDPRDKIYALLGLCGDTADAPRPDYILTPPEVYLQYARYFLTQGDGLMLLEEAGMQRSTMNVPSWVPDWTTDIKQGIAFVELGCNASGEMLGKAGVGEVGVSDDIRIIHVKGGKIDTIVELGPACPYAEITPIFQSELLASESLQAVLDWHAETWELFKAGDSKRYQSTKERLHAFSHLMGLQRKFNPENEDPDQYHLLLKNLRTYKRSPLRLTLQSAGSATFARLKAMKLYPQNRRFCITSRGHIGLVPSISEKGDVISAIAGSKPLYVLSKMRDGYVLVGDAFVLEMMNGEAVQHPEFVVEHIPLI